MIDWTKPIELDTVPPRQATIKSGPSYAVLAQWNDSESVFPFWVCGEYGEVLGCPDMPRVRNVASNPLHDAAPDLLAALRACEAFLFPGPGTGFSGGIDDAERLTRAAIAKATGQ